MFDLDLVKRLALTAAPSGNEAPVREIIAARLSELGIRHSVSSDGSLAAVIPSGSSPKGKLMLQAHMDEVGFMVRSHADGGFLKLAPLGIRDSRLLTGRRVAVIGKSKLLHGFIGAVPVHLSKDGKKIPPYSDLYVDIGAESKEEAEKLVPIGSFGAFESDFALFGSANGYLKSKALSSRVSCALLLMIAEHFAAAEAPLPYDLYFAFSPRGKLNLSGGSSLYSRLRPDCVISLTSFEIANDSSVASYNGVSVPLREEKYALDSALSLQLRKAFAASDKLYEAAPTAATEEREYDIIRLKNAGARVAAVKLPAKNRNSACEVMKRELMEDALNILISALPQIKL